MKIANKKLPAPYKRTVIFKDSNAHKWKIEVEITHRNKYPEFTMTGESGQCQDRIKPKGKLQKQLIAIWNEWHLNNEKEKPLPKDWNKTIDKLINDIEIEEKAKLSDQKKCSDLSQNDLFDYIEEKIAFIDCNTACAIGLLFNLTVNELIEEVEEEDDHRWVIQGTNYLIGTDEQMNEAVTENIKQSLWTFNPSFLSNQTDLPIEVFIALQPQCESANDAIEAIIEKNPGMDEFVEAAVQDDGRGHFLNHYDGSEQQIKFLRIDYYAYKD